MFLTGAPGVGKTSLVLRLEEYCRNRGLRVAGLITQEVREGGIRTGFRLRDISSGSEGWLARKNSGTGPRVGSYTVVSDDLDRIGAKALVTSASDDIDLVLVDEIGPMEMTSANFRNALSDLLNSEKMVVATVKVGSRYKEVEMTLNSNGAILLKLARESSNSMFQQIISRIESRALAKEQGTH